MRFSLYLKISEVDYKERCAILQVPHNGKSMTLHDSQEAMREKFSYSAFSFDSVYTYS